MRSPLINTERLMACLHSIRVPSSKNIQAFLCPSVYPFNMSYCPHNGHDSDLSYMMRFVEPWATCPEGYPSQPVNVVGEFGKYYRVRIPKPSLSYPIDSNFPCVFYRAAPTLAPLWTGVSRDSDPGQEVNPHNNWAPLSRPAINMCLRHS